MYLPQDELAQAGLSNADIFQGKVTDKWRSFMKGQIKRARMFFDEAEKGVAELNPASRWPVRSEIPCDYPPFQGRLLRMKKESTFTRLGKNG